MRDWLAHSARPAQRDLPQPFAAKRGHPQAAGGDRGPRRRSLVRWPGEFGIGVLPAAGSLDDRPAVVAAPRDPVDLVKAVLAEFGGIHPPGTVPRHALNVAVPVAPDESAERVTWRGPASRGHPQDLAAQRIPVLGQAGFGVLPRGRPQHAIRPEGQPPPVVDGGPRDAGDHGIGRPDQAARIAEPHDAVVGGGAEVHIDQPVPAERRGHRDPEQPALAVRVDARDDADGADLAVRGHPEQSRAIAFGDERVSARQERDRPRHRQVPHQHGRLADAPGSRHGSARGRRAAAPCRCRGARLRACARGAGNTGRQRQGRESQHRPHHPVAHASPPGGARCGTPSGQAHLDRAHGTWSGSGSRVKLPRPQAAAAKL